MKTVTDKALKAAKCPPDKRFQKVAIGQGLLLQINADGSKWWRFRHSFQATEKMLSLGVYPDVTLKAAGERRDGLRALLREGIDPGAERKRERATSVALTANSLESVDGAA